MDNYINIALSLGFTNAAWLDNLKIKCEEQLRSYCNPEECPNHGNNWVCPPGCGSLEECAKKVAKFSEGILLQSIYNTEPSTHDYKNLNQQHNLKLQAFLSKLPDIKFLALTSGGCIFCETCSYPMPCLNPDLRMNSLSAYGIDVGKLCSLAGFDYDFRQDKIYFTALVLMNNKAK